jgi:hypothetical protein
MANNITPKLKAFVRVDGTGRVLPGTPVLQASKPKVGEWIEIPMYDRGTTTTTTTTVSIVAYTMTSGGYSGTSGACSNLGGGMLTTVYGTSNPLGVSAFYYDQGLTMLFTGSQSSNHYGFYITGFPGAKYTAVIDETGAITGNAACVASTSYSLFDGSDSSTSGACALLNTTTKNTVYAAESSIDSITRLYSDSQLTTPVVGVQTAYQCLAVPGNGPMDPATNGHAVIIASNGNITSSVTCPTTTTTTTTAAPGVTTYGVSPTGYADRPTACAASFTPFAVYAASSNPASVTQFFNDSGLTVPHTGDDTSYYTYFVQSNPSVKYTANISSTIGEVLSKAAC